MNITLPEPLYTIPQKASLPFVSVPCALICFLFYKYGRKKLSKTETIDSRMINLYSAVAGGTLGQFFFHTLPNSSIQTTASNYSIISVFMVLGFFIMLCIQKCGRVCTEHTYYTGPENTTTEVSYTLNTDAMEQNEYFQAEDLENNEAFKTQMWAIVDEEKEIKRRLIVSSLFVCIMLFIGFLEGFFLVYKADITLGGPGVLIFMYYLNKMLQTVIFCVVMLYGLFHIPTNTRNKRGYLVFSLLWCLDIIFSTFPAILEMNKLDAIMFLHSTGLGILYAGLAGVLFWMALYFVWIDKRHTNKRETVKRLVLFAVFVFASFMTGYFI